MSLINKMLQDLDKRGSAPGEAAPADVKSVVYDEGRLRPLAIAGAVAVGLAVAAGAAFILTKRARAPDAVTARAPEQVTQMSPTPLVEQIPPEVVDEPAAAAPESAPVGSIEPEKPAAAKAGKAPTPEMTITKKPAPKAEKPPVKAAVAAAATPKMAPAASAAGLQITPRQRAETEYRRALASLQEGRTSEAVSALEQALRIDSRHEAARQTLVGLLMESGRRGEAMHLLQTGLILDPRQPAMAMLLARLQIEGGTSGIETLMRALPYANGDPEYHAFLAGALAHDDRHREAAEQYQAALRKAPANGVWWMGLGLSLQAEKRMPEAVAAFTRAKESTSLTPQLRAFVERKLQALSN
ncbi:tetratricopeptide repeat protein [Massilia cavernae]|uniref:Tetratricopeptide repeat protein n=1 Tax=Massilia cavernae TaxID=2320864 RepID=A0A418XPN8_9BURK|nr:tetratricopeptide repeat protein [Massilia cavernae]RJG14473.1 tetratricopeptide repeat protein [Massilia cavernae]